VFYEAAIIEEYERSQLKLDEIKIGATLNVVECKAIDKEPNYAKLTYNMGISSDLLS
jgi:hypothetical protein